MNHTCIIGKTVRINDVQGTIIDETKSTIVLDCDGNHKRFLKNAVTLTMDECVIQGSTLKGRPYERFKK